MAVLQRKTHTKSWEEYLLPKKPLAEYSGKELTVALLVLLAGGTLLVTMIAAPGLTHVFKHFGAVSKKDKYRLYHRLTELERAGYMHASGNYFVPTPKGVALIKKSLARAQARAKCAPWDGLWRMVMFDLPREHAAARQDLRHFLIDIGYVHYQHSVFVHKFDFQKEVEAFCALYGIRQFVNFMTVTTFDNRTVVEKEFMRIQKRARAQ